MEWQDPPFGCHLAIIRQLGPQLPLLLSSSRGDEASIGRRGIGAGWNGRNEMCLGVLRGG